MHQWPPLASSGGWLQRVAADALRSLQRTAERPDVAFAIASLVVVVILEVSLSAAYDAVPRPSTPSFLPNLASTLQLLFIAALMIITPVVVLVASCRMISNERVARVAADAAAAHAAADAADATRRRAAALAHCAAAEATAAAVAVRVAVGEDADANLCRVCLDSAISPRTPRFRCAHVVCEACADHILRGPASSCVCPFCRVPLRQPAGPAGSVAAYGAASSEEAAIAVTPFVASAAVADVNAGPAATAAAAAASANVDAAVVAAAVSAGAAAAVAAEILPPSEELQLLSQLEARLRARGAATATAAVATAATVAVTATVAAGPAEADGAADEHDSADERDSASLLAR